LLDLSRKLLSGKVLSDERLNRREVIGIKTALETEEAKTDLLEEV